MTFSRRSDRFRTTNHHAVVIGATVVLPDGSAANPAPDQIEDLTRLHVAYSDSDQLPANSCSDFSDELKASFSIADVGIQSFLLIDRT